MTQADVSNNNSNNNRLSPTNITNNSTTTASSNFTRRRRRGRTRLRNGTNGSSSIVERRIGQCLIISIVICIAYTGGIKLYGHATKRIDHKNYISRRTAARVIPYAKQLYANDESNNLLLNDDDQSGSQYEYSPVAKYEDLPYSQYKSLKYPFLNSKLIGLYFAASWCPISTIPSKQLDEYYNDKILLKPPPPSQPLIQKEGEDTTNEDDDTVTINDTISDLSIVYISSDKSENEMNEYINGRNWITLPFDNDNEGERTLLKKQFSTCAKYEVSQLNINRKFEIPTLIIIDSETHGILTMNGIEDLNEFGSMAIEHWIGLSSLVKSLQDKYYYITNK